MDETGEREITTIHDLPSEVLIKILGMLSYDFDLANAQGVSPLWYSLVNEKVGRRVCVGMDYLLECTEVDLDELSKIGVRSCCILLKNENEEERQIQNEDEREGENPLLGELRYAYLLKHLSLFGSSIPPDVFGRLVKNARNLSSLKTTLRTISKLRNEDFRNLNLKLPKLKELIVNDNWIIRQNEEFLPNLKTLLRENHFSQLTCLHVNLPRPCFIDLSMTAMLITFVQNHSALRQLTLLMDMTTDGGNILLPEPDALRRNELRTIIAGIRSRGDSHLTKLDLYTHTITNDLRPANGFPCQIEIIKEFLLKLVSLEDLILTLNLIPSSTLQAICMRNSATLMDITIRSDQTNVDCSVFTSLQHARSIWVESRQVIDGITQLPLSLTSFRAAGFLHQADANHILFNLPNMQEIYLERMRPNFFTPVDPRGSCVTLDMLNRFNANRRVDSIRIAYECLVNPESFPREGIPNNDPINPKMLQVVAGTPLFWKLNEDGFYAKFYY